MGLKKGSRKKPHSSADQNQPHLQSLGTRLDQHFFLNKSNTLQYKLWGAYIREGGYNRMYFLFAGRWAYKWGGLISGRCL